MNQLILLLGAGTTLEDARSGKYREATYFIDDQLEQTLETPFVGEALVRLTEETFDTVHIFGTTSAMWAGLLSHFGDPLTDDALFEALMALEENTVDELPDIVVQRIRTGVGEALGTRVEPHSIPAGHTQQEYWEMLKVLTDLDVSSGTVSIDITHSIRAHPIFLLLALVYLRSLHTGLSLGSVYYGAYVVRKDYDGRTPIFDLRPMVELLDWIDAAQAFDRHGDAAPLADLLDGYDSERLDDIAKRAKYVSQVLQLNTLSDIEANTRRFVRLLEDLPEDAPLPLQLIRPRLLDGPSQIQGQAKWQGMLVVARQHWSSYRAGLAVLAAWEAVIERFAEIYGLTGKRDIEVYKALSKLSRDTSLRFFKANGLGRLPEHVSRLNLFRNGIAHAEQTGYKSFQPQQVYSEFPSQLAYLEQHLGSPKLDAITESALLYDYGA